MREISQRYIAKKQEVCLKARSAPVCADAASQTSCVVDAGSLMAEVKKGEDELSAIMVEGRNAIASIDHFNRLLTKRFLSQQQELGRMPVDVKNKPLPSVNSRPDFSDAKPQPGVVEKPLQSMPAGAAGKPTVPSTVSGGQPSQSPAYDPPANIPPQEYGAKSWGDYERKLPNLIRQSESTTRQLKEFEEARNARQAEHKMAASEMAVKATQFFSTAEKLGYAGEEIKEWKKETSALKDPVGVEIPAAKTGEFLGGDPGEQAEAQQAGTYLPNKAKEEAAAKTALAETVAEPPKDEAALLSFESKLLDENKAPAVVAERARLRDLLKRRMLASNGDQPADGAEQVPGSLVGDILAEAKAIMSRAPGSVEQRGQEIGTVNVEDALREIESQLQELDRQAGILEVGSLSLFERVKSQLKRREKSWSK